MEFKGTTEKWQIDNNTIFANDYFQTNIAVLPDSYNDEILKANALLISKAPEMLEMLGVIYQQVDFSFSNWGSDTGLKMEEKIKQLIKEATEL